MGNTTLNIRYFGNSGQANGDILGQGKYTRPVTEDVLMAGVSEITATVKALIRASPIDGSPSSTI